jgi:hypothetical protein
VAHFRVIASEVTFGVNFLAISLETLRCAQQLTKLFMFLYQKGVRSQKISHQVALSAVHWQVAPHFAHLGLGADQYKQAGGRKIVNWLLARARAEPKAFSDVQANMTSPGNDVRCSAN